MTKVIALKPVYFDGDRYAIGQPIEMSDSYVSAYVRDGLVAAAGVNVVASVPVEEEVFASDKEELEALLKGWDSQMTPTEYLKKFPDGPDSEVALRIVELVAEEAELAQK